MSYFYLKENSIRKQKLVYLIWKSFWNFGKFFLSLSVSFASTLPSKSVVQMSVSNYSSKNYRFIIYSAKLLVPAKLSLETASVSQKKRKHEASEVSLSIQNQTRGLTQWIDSHTDFDFAVVSHEAGSENSGICFRWCEDLTSDHQHIMVCSDNPKQMEKTIKSFVRHEGKVLYEIRTRMFVPQSPLQTFINQFLGIGAVDVVRRGEQFEHFLRADELGLDKRTNEKMDMVWEIEKTCPVQLATLNEDQRRLLAKIESLQSSDSPFKSSLESFIDILAAGFGSVNMSEHSAFLKVECGLTEAQCSCWECWENDLINNEGSDEKNENPDMYLSQQTDY